MASRPTVNSDKSAIADLTYCDFENGQSEASNSECSDGTTQLRITYITEESPELLNMHGSHGDQTGICFSSNVPQQ